MTSSCGPESDWTSTLTIDRAGCGAGELTVAGIKGSAEAVEATVGGDSVLVSGDFTESGGTTRLTFTLTAESWARATGTEAWTWTDGAYGGTASVVLSRQE